MTIDLSQIDPDAVKVVQRLRRFGHEAYLVGGCVRDLLLGRKPKDFDVSTSATPPELRRLFRNCRIIGRRFRLAHIFFGPKIFETSTFRANPREGEDEEKGEATPDDLLIRRDNVFGNAEQDAQRRDFTVNGLFLDPETGHVTDYVNGLADIEARTVRTIGDPDIRFREDPIRILRAVKFAARCGLSIEPETLRCMVEHAQEISKCAQARVSEEFFRLLRAGAAHRSMELLVELQLLPVLMPALEAWRTGAAAPGMHPGPLREVEDAEPSDPSFTEPLDTGAEPAPDAGGERGADPQRLWSYLDALDQVTLGDDGAPSNAVVIATLVMPWLYPLLLPESGVRDASRPILGALRPFMEQLRISKRDAENTRQLLLVLRHFIPSRQPARKRPPRINNRDLAADLTWMVKVIAKAEAIELEGLPSIEPPEPVREPVGLSTPSAPRVAGGLSPIPTLPESWHRNEVRPRFLGTGAFGTSIGGAWRYAD